MQSQACPQAHPHVTVCFAVVPAHSQVTPAATQGGLPVVVGLGGADFSIDWGPGTRMEGITAWVDYYPLGHAAQDSWTWR